jgi:hypothetical protein
VCRICLPVLPAAKRSIRTSSASFWRHAKTVKQVFREDYGVLHHHCCFAFGQTFASLARHSSPCCRVSAHGRASICKNQRHMSVGRISIMCMCGGASASTHHTSGPCAPEHHIPVVSSGLDPQVRASSDVCMYRGEE